MTIFAKGLLQDFDSKPITSEEPGYRRETVEESKAKYEAYRLARGLPAHEKHVADFLKKEAVKGRIWAGVIFLIAISMMAGLIMFFRYLVS